MIYRFENKEYLLYFLLIPILIAFGFFVRWYKSYRLNKVGDGKVLRSMFPALSSTYFFLKYGILVFAVFFLIVGLLNPQTGSESTSTQTVGLEVNFIVDVSNSMLAEDLPPNRLVAAKKAINYLSNQLKEHKIGVTVFAGEAFNQIPPTADRNIVDAIVSSLSTDLVPTQGSSFKTAFDMAVQNFDPENRQSRFLILITDGENHGEKFLNEIKAAADNGITTHVIGVGTLKGATIPVLLQNGKKTLLKDSQGKVVVSALNEDFLQSISNEGGGIYSNIKDINGMLSIAKSINRMPRKVVTENMTSNFKDFFFYFICIALAFILVEFFMPREKFKKVEFKE